MTMTIHTPASTALSTTTASPAAAMALRNFDDALRFAQAAHKSGMYGVKSAEDALMRIATGAELGLGASQSLRMIHVFSGKPTLSADLMIGVCLRSTECAQFRMVESSAAKATYVAQRRDGEPVTLSWTIEEARAANLLGKDNWKLYPAAMLRARCISALARIVFPDILAGLYTPEELEPAPRSQAVRADVVPVDADGVMLDDASVLARDLGERIAAASTADELKALAAEVKRLPATYRDGLREAYAARKAALSGSGSGEVQS